MAAATKGMAKAMAKLTFFDTNVVVYAHDTRDVGKHQVARQLLRDGVVAGTAVVSQQVVQEFCHVALMKNRTSLAPTDLELVLRDILFPLMHPVASAEFYARALTLHRQYSLSWYDALIVQAAMDLNCSVLYSEDLQDGQWFGGLQVVNPFVSDSR